MILVILYIKALIIFIIIKAKTNFQIFLKFFYVEKFFIK